MPNYKLIKHKNGKITPQYGFYTSRAKIQAMGGAYANGKTTALAIKCLNVVQDYPGCEALLARATYPKLNDTLRKVFMKWCPPHWIKRKPTQDDNTCIMTNGSLVNFRYISQRGKTREDGSTTSNLLSATYDFIGVDQIEDPEIVYKDFLDLLGRLRGNATYRPSGPEDPTMPDTGPRWFCATSNPAHNWYYREVIYPYILWRDKGIFSEKLLLDAKTGLPLMELYEGDLYSNEENLDADYIRTQEAAYKGQMFDRYVMGKWAAYEGLVYPAYDRDRHVISRAQMETHLADCLKRHVRVFVIESYDFGMVVPSVYLYAFVDDFGRVFVLDGFHKVEFNVFDQPDAIRTIRLKYHSQLDVDKRVWADPSIFRKTIVDRQKNTGTTIAKIFKDDDIWMRAATNDIASGIAKVSGYLSGHASVPHLVSGEKPGPLIYFCDDMPWIEEEITSYYWKKNPLGQNIDQPMDGKDDAMDALKYLLAHLPQPADIVIPENALPPGYMFWHEEQDDAA